MYYQPQHVLNWDIRCVQRLAFRMPALSPPFVPTVALSLSVPSVPSCSLSPVLFLVAFALSCLSRPLVCQQLASFRGVSTWWNGLSGLSRPCTVWNNSVESRTTRRAYTAQLQVPLPMKFRIISIHCETKPPLYRSANCSRQIELIGNSDLLHPRHR